MAIAEPELVSEVMLEAVPDLVPVSPVYDLFLQAQPHAARLTITAGSLPPDFDPSSVALPHYGDNRVHLPISGARRIIAEVSYDLSNEWRVVAQHPIPDKRIVSASGYILTCLSQDWRVDQAAGKLYGIGHWSHPDLVELNMAIAGTGVYGRLRQATEVQTSAGKLFGEVMDRITQHESALGQGFSFLAHWFRKPSASDKDQRNWGALTLPPNLTVVAEPGL